MNKDYRALLVSAAAAEVGASAPRGDDLYIAFYNSLTGTKFPLDSTPWCAIFVTYLARKVGIPTSVIPNFASCTISRDSFWKPNSRWRNKSLYTPVPGDIIYFDWDLSGNCDHVGIVKDVRSGRVYTIEGNTKGNTATYGVREKSYPITYGTICGYAEPDYNKIDGNVSNNEEPSDNTMTKYVKEYQVWLNSKFDTGLVIDGSCGPLTQIASIKAIQTTMNREYGKALAVDGSFGPATKGAVKAIQQGAKGTLVYIAQGLLYGHGFNPDGFDGSFGPGMLKAIRAFQSWAEITVDGSCGPNTWHNLCTKW